MRKSDHAYLFVERGAWIIRPFLNVEKIASTQTHLPYWMKRGIADSLINSFKHAGLTRCESKPHAFALARDRPFPHAVSATMRDEEHLSDWRNAEATW